jgi:hypothetical protein
MLAYRPLNTLICHKGIENMADRAPDVEIGMDSGNLYQEESFTDRRIGSVQRLTPVTASGDRDRTRPILFQGQTQVMTPGGALPLSFELEAETLEEAVAQFGDQAKVALEGTMPPRP